MAAFEYSVSCCNKATPKYCVHRWRKAIFLWWNNLNRPVTSWQSTFVIFTTNFWCRSGLPVPKQCQRSKAPRESMFHFKSMLIAAHRGCTRLAEGISFGSQNKSKVLKTGPPCMFSGFLALTQERHLLIPQSSG